MKGDKYLLAEHANEVPSSLSCLVIHPETGTTCDYGRGKKVKVIDALKMPEEDWKLLDEALEQQPSRPEGSFTREEFQHRRGGIGKRQANELLQRLAEKGVIVKTRSGQHVYYQMVKAKDPGR